MKISAQMLKIIAQELSSWFDKRGRKFPWRFEKDVYKILVTEFLLQRTKSETVERIYHEFFLKYPSIQSLASAKKKELNKIFSRLGLRYRGDRLKKISLEILRKFKGEIPSDLESLLKLKGVGSYIASAVLNFGYNIPTPVIDKNVLRVLNRHFNITSEIEARKFVTELYKYGNHRKLAYALIDVGSLLCKKTCSDKCPLLNITSVFPLRRDRWKMLRKVTDKKGKIKLREQTV